MLGSSRSRSLCHSKNTSNFSRPVSRVSRSVDPMASSTPPRKPEVNCESRRALTIACGAMLTEVSVSHATISSRISL